MKISRFLSICGLALAGCFGSMVAYAGPVVEYAYASTIGFDQSYSACAVKHELTLAQWRSGSEPADEMAGSNLIALSNHFGMAGAFPFGLADERPDV